MSTGRLSVKRNAFRSSSLFVARGYGAVGVLALLLAKARASDASKFSRMEKSMRIEADQHYQQHFSCMKDRKWSCLGVKLIHPKIEYSTQSREYKTGSGDAMNWLWVATLKRVVLCHSFRTALMISERVQQETRQLFGGSSNAPCLLLNTKPGNHNTKLRNQDVLKL